MSLKINKSAISEPRAPIIEAKRMLEGFNVRNRPMLKGVVKPNANNIPAMKTPQFV